MDPRGEAPPNATHLRDDINRGRTGEKVAGTDPAAAPLGTDEEAAGAPPSAGEIDQARRAERKPGADPAPNAANPEQTPTGDAGRSMSGKPVLAAAVIVVVLVVVVWVLLSLSA